MGQDFRPFRSARLAVILDSGIASAVLSAAALRLTEEQLMIYEEAVVVPGPIDEVLGKVKSALADQGFGTLTEIDMQATLSLKIDKEIEPYVIIGACNPRLAARALDIDRRLGVLLPCNVVVRADGGDTVVEAMDPGVMSQLLDSDDLVPVAAEARELIGAALSSLLGED